MSNRLARESSPYLLQHADNPVDWYPWCEEALTLAEDQDRPILLSIGYSACHWCHVMAHESFEDEATAALMNERFVCIKVDREERPDLDKLYQLAHQVITRRPGGWPLTLALDPHTHAPFFAGTYFPPAPRMGMPDFPSVLLKVADWYSENRDQLGDQGDRMREVFAQLQTAPGRDVVLDDTPLQHAAQHLQNAFDPASGGFGGAPRFPQAQSLELLFTLSRRLDRADLADMASDTLAAMAAGGLHDHVGGGFFRYTIDGRWQIPHFEKMLYDNAALLPLYARRADASDGSPFAEAASRTVDWLLREMQAPEGGFQASLDADSDGQEGGFYVWDRDTVQALLGDDYDLFARHFGLDQPPNFEGRWHLTVHAGLAELATGRGEDPDSLATRIERARRRLFDARERRPRPGRDHKILTAWNAMAIRGLAIAARVCPAERDRCLQASARALDCIREHLWREGRLLTALAGGKARLPGYLDDYALLADAIIERLQAQWRSEDAALAAELAEAMLDHFHDNADGGFFFTADDHETLLYRLKPMGDDSTPAGNGVAALALLRLGALLAEPRYLDAAEDTLRAAWPTLSRQPTGHASLCLALADALAPPPLVILRGAADALPAWQSALDGVADALVFAIPAEADGLPTALADKAPAQDGVRAYVCRGMTCSEPLDDLDTLRARLAAG